MVINMRSQNTKETVMLSIAVGVVALATAGQYVFSAQPLLWRFVGLLLAFAVAVLITARTELGKRMWAYWQDSVIELRKVVWPTKQETIQSTIAVLAMVFVMGLVLWSIDAILVRLVAWIVKQGAV